MELPEIVLVLVVHQTARTVLVAATVLDLETELLVDRGNLVDLEQTEILVGIHQMGLAHLDNLVDQMDNLLMVFDIHRTELVLALEC